MCSGLDCYDLIGRRDPYSHPAPLFGAAGAGAGAEAGGAANKHPAADSLAARWLRQPAGITFLPRGQPAALSPLSQQLFSSPTFGRQPARQLSSKRRELELEVTRLREAYQLSQQATHELRLQADAEHLLAEQAILRADQAKLRADMQKQLFDSESKNLRTQLAAAQGMLNMRGVVGACC
jgi:signal transduction histidine kinase